MFVSTAQQAGPNKTNIRIHRIKYAIFWNKIKTVKTKQNKEKGHSVITCHGVHEKVFLHHKLYQRWTNVPA